MPGSSLSTHADAEPPSPQGLTTGHEANTPQPCLPKRGAVVTGVAGLLTPPVAGVATTELGAHAPVVALVIVMSLIPSVPMLVCAYVWSHGALKAIRAAAQGESKKSKDIVSAMTGALQALPPALGGSAAGHPHQVQAATEKAQDPSHLVMTSSDFQESFSE